jgi:hypothetical protein
MGRGLEVAGKVWEGKVGNCKGEGRKEGGKKKRGKEGGREKERGEHTALNHKPFYIPAQRDGDGILVL